VKIGRTVEKLFKRGFFDKNCSLAPVEGNFENVDDLILFPRFAESISILHVKIGRTVQKLFKGEDFWKFPNCSPKRGLQKF
jgi:hypothetical protein